MTGRFLTTALALAAVVIVTACAAAPTDTPRDTPVAPQVCTLIGCSDGLQVAIEPKSGWPEGTYLFEIQADDVYVRCRASLPLRACTDSRDTPPISSVVCDPFGVVQVVESGCALPPVNQGFPAIVFDPELRPQRVEIAVTWNRTPVGRAEFAPRFEKVQPNGASCPPICHFARAALLLDFQGG